MKRQMQIGLGLVMMGMVLSCAGNASAPTKLDIGKPVPMFTLPDIEGSEFSLSSFLEKKFTVLVFVSTQCPIANDYNERMVRLFDEYSPRDVAIVGINSNKQESVDEIKEHAKKHGFKFPILKDWENKIADSYNAQVTPEIFVVDGKGTLLYHGRIDDSRDPADVKSRDLSAALDALLVGKEVPVSTTKAFGCTIKRVKK